MSHAKRVSKRKRRGKAMPVLGAAGFLALASGASAEAPVDTSTPNTGVSRQIFLGEEEISDVSLATFYVFDKENTGSLKPGVHLARGGGGCGGCGGGGCRGCGGCGGGCARGCGGGCRVGFGFGGCGGCGCAGCGLGWWGLLRRRVRCRDRVCCRCRLLHNLGRLPLLLGNRGGALLGVTWSRSRSRRHRPHSAAVRVAVKRDRTRGLNRR